MKHNMIADNCYTNESKTQKRVSFAKICFLARKKPKINVLGVRGIFSMKTRFLFHNIRFNFISSMLS